MTLIPASSVSVGGVTVLSDTTLAANAATIDTGAGAIASGYLLIRVVALLRTTQAAETSAYNMTVNNDSSAIYDLAAMTQNNVTQANTLVLAGTAWSFGCPGANADAGAAGAVQIDIPYYDQTTFHKSANGLLQSPNDAAAENYCIAIGARYRSTAAITRVAVAATSGNFLAGSRLTVLGVGVPA